MSETALTPVDPQEFERLKKAYAKAPSDIETATKLAHYYTDRNNIGEGIKIYKALKEIYPQDYSILLAYGNACFGGGDLKTAITIFKQLTQLKPSRVEGWNNLGITQLTLNKNEAAKKSFSKVLDLEPENHGALLNLGNYYSNIDNFKKALEFFKKATIVRPDFIDAWYNMGNTQIQLELYSEAIATYEKALKYDPKFYSVYKNIGFAYEKMEHYDKAEKFYSQAMGIDKEDHTLWVNLANVYAKLLEYDKAKKHYLAAVKMAPKEPAAWLGLRELSLEKGDIQAYVKSTLAILHRLKKSEIAESLKKMRQLDRNEDTEKIMQAVDTLKVTGDEIDGERMLVYLRTNREDKAQLLMRRLRNLANPSDQVLVCLAEYSMAEEEYAKVIHYCTLIKNGETYDRKLLWIAHIEKRELTEARELIENYLVDNKDCFEGWYQLARLKAMTHSKRQAKECLLRAIETGFTDFELLDTEKELKKIYKSIPQ